nr:PD-(D/E)XK nuclease family transposase [Succinatimonas hippei]
MNTQNNKNERKIINRLNDAFFKNLFGRAGHEKYLISLLNSMFESVPKGRRIIINTLSYLNREIDPITDNGKACRMDLMAQIDDGSIIDIEIQLLNSSSNTIRKRTLYYFSTLYERGIKSGDDYAHLHG